MLTVAEFGEERAAAGIPDTLQALIAARIDRLEHRFEGGAAAGIGDRPQLLGRRDRASVERRERRERSRGPPATRPRRPPASLVALQGEGLSLQARPHPRRRLREPHEVRSSGAPRALRRVAGRAGGRRAARDPGAPPRPCGVSARRPRRRATGRPRATGRGDAPGSRPAGSRPRGEPGCAQLVPARHWSSSRPSSAGISPRRRPGASTTFPQSLARWSPCARRLPASATGSSKERRLPGSPT